MQNEIQNQVLISAVNAFCENPSDARIVWIWASGNPVLDRHDLLWSLGVNQANAKVLPNVVILDERSRMLTLIDVAELNGPIDDKRRKGLARAFRASKLKLRIISAFKDRSEYQEMAIDTAWKTMVWFADEPDHVVCFDGKELKGSVS